MTLPAGVYAESYDQDQALIRTRSQWWFFIGFLVSLFVLPLLGWERLIGFMNILGITVIAVVGLQINVGYAGQINLGQSAFMGVGAYTAGALTLHFNLPIWITIPTAGVSAALFGAIFGLAAVRIKGFYLALTTIAAHFVFAFVMVKLPKTWFGKTEGIRLDPVSFLGLEFDTDTKMYFLIYVIVVVMLYGAWSLTRSRLGRAFVAIRDNENAAGIIGINTFSYKLQSFFVGAFYAGIAGALWAYYIRYVSADEFSLWLSIWYLAMLVVGGMSSTILGAVIGTFVIRLLQDVTSYLGPQMASIGMFSDSGWGQSIFASMNILLGAIVILFVIFEPRGLLHRWLIIKESYRIWPFPH